MGEKTPRGTKNKAERNQADCCLKVKLVRVSAAECEVSLIVI